MKPSGNGAAARRCALAALLLLLTLGGVAATVHTYCEQGGYTMLLCAAAITLTISIAKLRGSSLWLRIPGILLCTVVIAGNTYYFNWILNACP